MKLIFTLLCLAQVALAAPKKVRVVCLGDSLTEGYQLAESESYPYLLQQKLSKEGFDHVEIVNAGISGSTSASAEKRLKWQMKQGVDILLLALGGNDGLRGHDPENLYQNLEKVINQAKSQEIKVILAGIKVPRNMGSEYTEKFDGVFPRLASSHELTFIPFLLEGVAGIPDLNLPDGIHPNAKGHAIIAETVYRQLKPLLKAATRDHILETMKDG